MNIPNIPKKGDNTTAARQSSNVGKLKVDKVFFGDFYSGKSKKDLLSVGGQDSIRNTQ